MLSKYYVTYVFVKYVLDARVIRFGSSVYDTDEKITEKFIDNCTKKLKRIESNIDGEIIILGITKLEH